MCQICDRPGHSALDCFNRLNLSYEGRMPSKKLSAMAAQRLPSDPSSSTWICDSGANTHITSDVNNIINPSEYHGLDQVGGVGKDLSLPITHIGSSSFSSCSKPLQLNNILHCPTASTNLLSIHQFNVDNHCYFILYPYYFVLKDLKTGRMLFKGKCEDGLYPLHLPFKKSSQSSRPLAFLGSRVSSSVWHSRLGHPAHSIVSLLVSNKCLPIEGATKFPFCNSCPLGKSHKLPFNLSNSVSNYPLELLHSDVWTSPTFSNSGFKYYVIFVYDFSRYTWLFPMRMKSEAFKVFVEFKTYVENLLSCKIKTLQTDEGGEFKNTAMQQFPKQHGIGLRFSCPKYPEQNGLGERKHRHNVETSITLLAHAHIPSSFWVDAFNTAIYLMNRLPSKVLKFASPYAKLFDRPPNYNFLKVFGCACFPHLRFYNTNKLQLRSKRCVFIGYSLQHQGYHCLDTSTGRVYLSRHVIFDETSFPFQEKSLTFSSTTSSSTSCMNSFPSLSIKP